MRQSVMSLFHSQAPTLQAPSQPRTGVTTGCCCLQIPGFIKAFHRAGPLSSKTGGKDSKKSRKKFRATCSSDRSTRTPHSGYHYDGTPRRFFEGWYFKISLPREKESFAWMYSIEDPFLMPENQSPAASLPFVGSLANLLGTSLGPAGSLLGLGVRFPGVGAQILGPGDEYLWQFDTNVESFWGTRHELELGNTFKKRRGASGAGYFKSMVPAERFMEAVEEGFQVSPTLHQGSLRDNGRSPEVPTVESCSWEYVTQPIYGWGDIGRPQKSTAGWLAVSPLLEPHWQICMAGGLSTGWVQWGQERYEFVDAPSYAEKNWGGSFPKKWFWVQCNVFDGVEGEVALTAGGGKRGSLLSPSGNEEVAMVGIHFGGRFYEFVPWKGEVGWDIATWGQWKIWAKAPEYEVELEATTQREGTVLRAPTAEAGLTQFCRDTFFGDLKVTIWERTTTGARGNIILDATSDMAALEVGGGPWWSVWQNSSNIAEPLRSLVDLPLDPPTILAPVPKDLQPPGL